MNAIGYREAMADAITVDLVDGASCLVASIPGLAILKLFAWADREERLPGKDASDFYYVLRNYPAAGNQGRLYTEAAHLLEDPGFDYDRAGAWLLGWDARALLKAE